MSKVVAFICQSIDIDPVLREYRKENVEMVLITINQELAEEVVRKGESARNIQDYAGGEYERELRKKVVLWIDEWAEKRPGNGQSLKEFLRLRDFSLWWFALPVLFPDVLRCVQYVDLIYEVMRRESPQKILLGRVIQGGGFPLRLNRDPNLPGIIISLTCSALGKEIEYFGARSTLLWQRLAAFRLKLAFTVYNKLLKSLFGLLRRGLAFRLRGKSDKPINSKIVVFSSPVYWRECLDDSGEIERNDAVVGSCIRELKRRHFDLVGVDTEVNVPSRKLLSVVREKLKRADIKWRVIEQFKGGFSFGLFRKKRASIKKLKKAWLADAGWRRELCYRGVALEGLLGRRFDYLFDFYFDEAIGYIEAIDRIAVYERPELFLLVYEEGAYGRAATIIGQKRGIPTLALQHGTLSGPYLPSYFFHKVSLDLRRDSTSCPIPNCTAVFGKRTKDMLTQVSAYPDLNVEVVGMPSIDSAIRAQQVLARTTLCNVLQVEDDKPIVLVISQPFFNRENRDTYINMVLEAASVIGHVQWVVKLHPSESAIDWESAISRRKLEGIKIAQGHIQMWLMACSVLVAWFSTTMLEAALLNKPVYAVYIPHCPNAEMYVEDGIAIRADDSGELADHLRAFQETAGSPRKRLGSSNLSDHVYKPDGNAAARVADLAENLIGTSSKG